MIRKVVRLAALALAIVLVSLAALLLHPTDAVEFLAGFVVGSVTSIQVGLLAAAVLLAAVSAGLDRGAPVPRWRRLARRVLGGVVAATVVGMMVRDYGMFTRETVELGAGDVQLAGTVYRPRFASTKRLPALLVLHGSGPSKRHAYHFLARRFAEHGMIVLNVDKRGVGGSGGRYSGDDLATGVIQLRARDARVALEYLASRDDVDTARVGLFAISQGGWVVPLLLGGDTPARFAVTFSGSTVSSREEGQWSDWTNENGDHFGMRPPPVPFEELDRRIRDVAPGDFDPRLPLSRMRAPTLWLYGEWDSSQPALASVRVLDSLSAIGVPATSRVFTHANHGLMIARGPGGRRFPNFAPGVWDTVFAWMERQGVRRLGSRD